MFGFPEEGVAKSPTAKAWENLVDHKLRPNLAEDYLPYGLMDQYRAAMGDYPHGDRTPMGRGIEKAIAEGKLDRDAAINAMQAAMMSQFPPDQSLIPLLAIEGSNNPVYNIGDEITYDLGFDHLTDELYNMLHMGIHPEHLSPNWPKDLVLTPKQVETMSVEDMVKKVAKVNQHRDKMAKEAFRKKSERLQNLPILAQSDDGYRLVQHGDASDPDAQQLIRTCGEKNKWCTQGEALSREYGSGRNRLVNILDPNGEPVQQATVETLPIRNPFEAWHILSEEDRAAIDAVVESRNAEATINGDIRPAGVTNEEYKELIKNSPSYQAYVAKGGQKRITELKGYDNSTTRLPDVQRSLFMNWMKENGIEPNLQVADQLGMSLHPKTQTYVDDEELIHDIFSDNKYIQALIDNGENPAEIDSYDLIGDYQRWMIHNDPNRI
jgi:hypothetical protein